jgi:hypothetical protein
MKIFLCAVIGLLGSASAFADREGLSRRSNGVERDSRYIDPDGLSSTRYKDRGRSPFEVAEISCSDVSMQNHSLRIIRRDDSSVEGQLNLNRGTHREEIVARCNKYQGQATGGSRVSYDCLIGKIMIAVDVDNGAANAGVDFASGERLKFNCSFSRDKHLP